MSSSAPTPTPHLPHGQTPQSPTRASSTSPAIAVDPHDANGATIYATIMGFGVPHLYRSTNFGGTWTNLSANLPDAPANAVFIDPNDANTVYVALDTGVYVTQADQHLPHDELLERAWHRPAELSRAHARCCGADAHRRWPSRHVARWNLWSRPLATPLLTASTPASQPLRSPPTRSPSPRNR